MAGAKHFQVIGFTDKNLKKYFIRSKWTVSRDSFIRKKIKRLIWIFNLKYVVAIQQMVRQRSYAEDFVFLVLSRDSQRTQNEALVSIIWKKNFNNFKSFVATHASTLKQYTGPGQILPSMFLPFIF